MSEATTISAMLKSVVEGPAWHGPSVIEQLEGMTAAQARRKPLENAHSIWEILLHMAAWQDYALRVLDGGDASPLEGDADWPPVPAEQDENAWEAAKRSYGGGMRDLRERVVHLDDAQLHKSVPGRDFPMKVLLHGVVHHNLYHCGQIALLKKD